MGGDDPRGETGGHGIGRKRPQRARILDSRFFNCSCCGCSGNIYRRLDTLVYTFSNLGFLIPKIDSKNTRRKTMKKSLTMSVVAALVLVTSLAVARARKASSKDHVTY